MDARQIIARLRDGGQPTGEEIRWFAAGLASGEVSDAQAGAFAMAVLLRGLGEEGRVALTLGMRDSGRVMSWQMDGPVVDKHSTGGIGDCVSILLAPALAAAGAYVPMLSGRGLGFAGGTLDKLEAIPGVRIDLDEASLRRQVAEVRCAIVAATRDLAPADRRLYAIRNVTSTVESIDLITASILSKKLAAGPEALVLDIKCGSGAFMKTEAEAGALAEALVRTAQGAGCRTAGIITDMSRPLARAAGNALEVAEVMEALEGREFSENLMTVTVALGGELLALAGMVADAAAGEALIREVIGSGAAMDWFGRMVAAQGGPRDFTENWRRQLPKAPVERAVPAPVSGHVAAIEGEALGHAVVHLGGGRLRESDRVNPAVGLTHLRQTGERVERGEPLAIVHAADEAAAERAARAVTAAYRLHEAPVTPAPLLHRKVG